MSGRLLAGNRRGLNIDMELGRVRNDITSLQDSDKDLQAKGKKKIPSFAALEDCVDPLRTSLNNYKLFRGRCISTVNETN